MGASLHIFFVLSCLVLVSQAHFLLRYPETAGFDDDNESEAPCGGFDVSFEPDKTTNWNVGGDSIYVQSTHPVAQWLFRATLDKTAASNWTNLAPVIAQNGLGQFCEPNLTVPDTWAGQQGVIQIVQDAADGLLYQCAAVSFVSGTAASLPSGCRNVTGLSASYTSNSALSSLATPSPEPAESASATATPAVSTPATVTGTGLSPAATTGAANALRGRANLVAIFGAGLVQLLW